MIRADELSPDVIAQRLMYAGFALVAYELVKSMIVGPIKAFYADTTFGQGMPFQTYEKDVRSRDSNEFEACLLYLRDFMEAIDADDLCTIKSLRQHRNALAHDLVRTLPLLEMGKNKALWEKVDRVIFKLSNYRSYMEIGADPEFRGINWERVEGGEYLLFKRVAECIQGIRPLDPGPETAVPPHL